MAFVDKPSILAALRSDIMLAERRWILGDDFLVVSAGKRCFDGVDSLISTRWFHRQGHTGVCGVIVPRSSTDVWFENLI